MKKKSRKKPFIVTIKTNSDDWDYVKGGIIKTVVFSSTKHHLQQKCFNKWWGGMYPLYEIINIEECDNFLFEPILT